MRIFLSHSTTDRAIAESVKELLENVFAKKDVQVEFSSDQGVGGGIPPGAQWLSWIIKRITEADKTYVLLTPNSLAKPWVLWESGAAAGVALATKQPTSVVPITFGVSDADVPSPLKAAQRVVGDSDGAGGIQRILQDVNTATGKPLTNRVLDSRISKYLPCYLDQIKSAVHQSPPPKSLLASVPPRFPAERLRGLWVTCFQFDSDDASRFHADIVEVTPESSRRLRARTYGPQPRTEGHHIPFRDEIEAELADGYVIGQWKNVSDYRYFGAIHLAVLPGERVLEGHYTSFGSLKVLTGPWKWVRLGPATIGGVDLMTTDLLDPTVIHQRLLEYSNYEGPLALTDIVKGVCR